MEDFESVNGSSPSPCEMQPHEDAVPMESDKSIWVRIDGGEPVTLFEVIVVNSEPDVVPLTHFTVTGIRNLPIGGVWADFGDAEVQRVAEP